MQEGRTQQQDGEARTIRLSEKAMVEGSENLNCSVMFELQTLMTNPFTVLQYYLG